MVSGTQLLYRCTGLPCGHWGVFREEGGLIRKGVFFFPPGKKNKCTVKVLKTRNIKILFIGFPGKRLSI